ncbi:MAG: protein translocase subunit SecD [Opitutaceae bacterium]|nr:protein translocase subunit SecD [Opitutaceae bacterium]
MSGKYTWKLIITAAVMIWAVLNLNPISTTPFEDYLRQEATTSPAFEAVMLKAKQRLDAKEAPSFYVALKQVAEADATDLSQFFPQVNLEKSLQNIRKKNSILLDHLLKQSQARLRKGLDLSGGISFLLEVDRPAGVADATQQQADLDKAIEIIGERIDGLGVSEPIIRPVGEDRIEVQIAGVNTRDNPEVVNELKKPARLEFRLVDMVNRPDPNNPSEVPIGYELLVLNAERGANSYEEELFVKRVPEMTGEAVERAFVYRNDYGQAEVGLRFTSKGGDRFGEVTRKIVDEHGRGRGRLAIVLDGKLYSAPTVNDAITGGNAQITGSFTDREAFELANVLNNPLDVPLRVVSMSEVGPSLAADSVSSGWKAFIIGTSITAAFIIVYYTSAGLLAVLAMGVNVVIILGAMASDLVGATLSMPGIAGIVLTLGMSVDSNILIFERLREEVAAGKNLRAALDAAHEKAFSAIFDANITTLITAVLMWTYGTGPVKGFGVTLTIGIFSTMFAALIVTRLLLELIVHTGVVKKIKMFQAMPETNIDFLKYARPAFIASFAIVAVGVAVVLFKGDKIYGIDFAGGDEVTLSFAGKPLDVAQVRAAASQVGVTDINPAMQKALGTGAEVMKVVTPYDQGDKVVMKLKELYPDAGLKVEGEERIGGSVSSQIKWNAMAAIGLSLVGILIYVAFRFEIGYGIGAVVSTLHDLLMTIGVFVAFGNQFNAAMVGAILLIAGYSINDTIVVFDRIREELQLNPNMKLRDVINHSLNRTLARTVITGGTTFCTAITLYVVAGGAVNDIAFTLIIGIITGTFSSLFIASPIFYWWHKGDRKHVEESHDIAPKYEWTAGSKAAE